jgi:Icc protein
LGVIRVLQLSDPHLVADPIGQYRQRQPRACLVHAWQQALDQLSCRPDLVLITGDLCQDESWSGYAQLRDLLDAWAVPAALLPGNHDHPLLLHAALGRRVPVAPVALPLGTWTLLLLSTHRAGAVEGWIEPAQLLWLEQQLACAQGPLLVALHHPPLPIGSVALDRIALRSPQPILKALLASTWVRGVVFGHVHQHWQGQLPRAGSAPTLPFWAAPSTLAAFEAVQPCPLAKAHWPGGRLLNLAEDGSLVSRLLRWPPCGLA